MHDTYSEGSVTNSKSSVSASTKGSTSVPDFDSTSAANILASSSPNPHVTKLPFENMNTSPTFPSTPHVGTQSASCKCRDDCGRDPRILGSTYLVAVVRVNTGWIVLRVGVGFERIGNDAEAARRRGVEALGFRFLESSSSMEDDALAKTSV